MPSSVTRYQWSPLALLCCVLIVAVRPAEAQTKRAAVVLPVEVTSPAHSHLANTITASLRRELAQFADLADQGLIDFSLSEAQMSFSCMDEAEQCMATIGETVGVQVMFWGRLTVTRTGLSLSLRGIDVSARRLVYSLDTSLQDSVALEQNIDGITSAFLSGQDYRARRETTLKFRSAPSGASVWVDGRPYGVTPTEVTVASGVHQIRIEETGYVPIYEEITVTDSAETLRYSLERSAVSPAVIVDRPPAKPTWPIWVTTTLSSIAVGAGIYGGVKRYQAFQWRQDEFRVSDAFDNELSARRAAIIEANADMNAPLEAELTREFKNVVQGRELEHARDEAEYDKAVLTGNIALGVAGAAGIAALTSAYFFFFYDKTPDVAVHRDQLILSFDF